MVVHEPDLPGGELRGRDAGDPIFNEMMTGFDSMEVRQVDMFAAGDGIVSLVHTAGSGEGTSGRGRWSSGTPT